MYGKLVAAAALVLAPVLTSVSGAAITNVTTGQTIWSDTFEAGTVGATPALNQPSVGSYTQNAAGTGNTIIVNNAAGAGFAAYDGQFLTMTRSSTGVTQNITTPAATGLTGKTLESASGDTIKFTFGIRVEDFGKVGSTGAGSVASLFFYNSTATTTPLLQLNFYGEGAFNVNKGIVRNVTAGVTAANLTTEFTPSAWNTIELTHVQGTNQWTFAMNDGTPVNVTGATSALSADLFNFRAGAAGTAFSFDSIAPAAVPEPASLGVVGLAALGLLARRRRSAC